MVIGHFGCFFFSARGGGGSSRGQEGGGFCFILKILQERGVGGVSQERGGGVRGWESVWGEFGGGGVNIFFSGPKCPPSLVRKAPDTFQFSRHVMRAIWSVRPKRSHRCVSRKETPLKSVPILIYAIRRSTEQTSMRTKWFKHIAI